MVSCAYGGPEPPHVLFLMIFCVLCVFQASAIKSLNEDLAYIWPSPSEYNYGNETFSVDPGLVLDFAGSSAILRAAFDRYRGIIFEHRGGFSTIRKLREAIIVNGIKKLSIVVHADNEELQLGVDESYNLTVAKDASRQSTTAKIYIEANTVYGALRGLETFSQLCSFDYVTKSVQIRKAPWYIRDKPRFAFRGLLLDTSRHYYPVFVIKQIIESMSYAKLNVLHWHIIDRESFPLEVPSYRKLWKGSYTKWERYTLDDAKDIVNFAKMRGIHVMPEVDVPGHAKSWGNGYPELWPSPSCQEPLDITKNLTFDIISGILTDMRKVFPFGLFHLGGDEVDTGCWSNSSHINQWLRNHKMTAKDAYQYFVLKAQEIAISNNWIPVNWEETFNAFASKLNPLTVVHNWLGPGVCPKAVANGFKCIFSNQGVWYLDHLDVPWEDFYTAEPVEGIEKPSEQNLVIGGEVCMWGETADTSDVQQTIWPRAAAAAERLWSPRDVGSGKNIIKDVLPRLHYFRCLLNRRGIAAAPVTNSLARMPPVWSGSCYDQ